MFDRLRDRRLVLALSLGLNLLLIGWVATGHFVPDCFKSDPAPAPEVLAARIVAALPWADGNLLLGAVALQRQPLLDAHDRYLAAFNRLRTVIASDPLDQATLRQTVADLRATRLAERTLFGDIIVDTLPHMSAAGRQAFVATHMGGRQ